MGGDFGPSVVVPAALTALAAHTSLYLTLVGQIEAIQPYLGKALEKFGDRLVIQDAREIVTMDEPPAVALRTKKDTSMRVAIDLVKAGKVEACVSAGNTGALMAIARFVLKTIPGIDRPAIVYSLPAEGENGRIRMLDLGANVDCNAEHLYQFAVMGSVLTAAVDNIQSPRVGLLNIGSEAIKGPKAVKEAAELLMAQNVVNYIGYIEGTDLYRGKAHVVVCDGFGGNIALKTSEGVARMFFNFFKIEFSKTIWTRLVGMIARPMLKKLSAKFDPSGYNGASLLGLNGIVIKSHGHASEYMYVKAIEEAILEVEHNVPEQIRSEVVRRLQTQSS